MEADPHTHPCALESQVWTKSKLKKKMLIDLQSRSSTDSFANRAVFTSLKLCYSGLSQLKIVQSFWWPIF